MTQTILDEAVLEQLREIGGPSFVAELVDLYVADAGPRIAILREAARSRDAEAFAREAHALKSSSGNIGAAAARALCLRLETMGRSGVLDASAEPLVEQLEEEVQRAVREIRGKDER